MTSIHARANQSHGDLGLLSTYVLQDLFQSKSSIVTLQSLQNVDQQIESILHEYLRKYQTDTSTQTQKQNVLSSEFIFSKIRSKSSDATSNFQSDKKQIADTLIHRFNQEALIQKNVLLCPDIDEHVLLLTSLKILENEKKIFVYPTVLKELLKKNVHKSHDFDLGARFVGRLTEIESVKRILSLTERNNALIIGPVGVGKTALAKAVMRQIDSKQSMQLFPGSDTLEDQVLHATATTKYTHIFLLDEIFSFSIEEISFLMNQGQIVATASETAYRKFAAEQSGILSKYNVLSLDEPDSQLIAKIIEAHRERVQNNMHVEFTPQAINEIVKLAKQHLHELSFPAKGIGLLEEAAHFVKSTQKNVVTPEMVRVLVSQKANIPIAALTDLDKKDLSKLEDRILKKVKGQDHAVTKVSRSIQRSRLGFKKDQKPIGSFLFVGPSGVGKTELTKVLAKEVFGDEDSLVRLDMSEYSEAHTVQRLIGAPPGYLGFEEGGQLTNPIQKKPYSLILLDEIEKAHPKVFDVFLQILDDGRLTDGRGKKVDFRNTLLIATSNAGIDDILDLVEEGKQHSEIETEIKDIMQDFFRIEFLNRFDDIIVFKALDIPALAKIARIKINQLVTDLANRGITLEVKHETLQLLAEHAYDPRYGARGLERLIQSHLENPLVEMMINDELKSGEKIVF